jgi:hypothetical protein
MNPAVPDFLKLRALFFPDASKKPWTSCWEGYSGNNTSRKNLLEIKNRPHPMKI